MHESAEVSSRVHLTVDGVDHTLEVDNRSSLLDTLRDQLDVTGPKRGCDHGQCGSCTVLVDGRRANSCLLLTVAVAGRTVRTVAGLGGADNLNALQEAFVEYDALQCGFCTPGQLCSATAMLDEVAAGWPSAVSSETDPPALDAAEIRERMSGNLCRCGAYPNIVAAIQSVRR
jgi:xanthine dehydrogenase YagT iron-sulfur-binding subunit